MKDNVQRAQAITFQYLLVRLKASARSRLHWRTRFQYLLVRLKGDSLRTLHIIFHLFQYLLVRLKE